MDEQEQLEQSRGRALQLASDATTHRERDYYLAVADCTVNSYGHGAKLMKEMKAIQGG